MQLDKYSPSPTIPSRSRVGSQPTVSPTDLSSYSPSSPTQNQLLQKREDNVVRVITVSPVFSPPPPHSAPSPQTTMPEPSISPPPPTAPTPTAPPPTAPLAEATSPQFPVTFRHEPSDGSVAQQVPSLYPSTTTEPSKQATYPPPATSTYPPPPQNTSSTPSTYPHSGGATTYPPAGGPATYPPPARYPTPGGGYGVPSSYPPPAGGPPAYGQGPYPMAPSPRGYYGANVNANYSRSLANRATPPPHRTAQPHPPTWWAMTRTSGSVLAAKPTEDQALPRTTPTTIRTKALPPCQTIPPTRVGTPQPNLPVKTLRTWGLRTCNATYNCKKYHVNTAYYCKC